MHPVKHSDNFSRVKSVQKQYQLSDTIRKRKEYSSHSIFYALHTMKIEVT